MNRVLVDMLGLLGIPEIYGKSRERRRRLAGSSRSGTAPLLVCILESPGVFHLDLALECRLIGR